MKNPKIQETKERLKLLAKLISRNKKIDRESFSYVDKKWNKNQPESGDYNQRYRWYRSKWDEWAEYRKEHNYQDYTSLSHEFRHLHIAYCEVRGRERDAIEKPKEGNEPNEATIEQYKKDILEGVNEDVRVAAK